MKNKENFNLSDGAGSNLTADEIKKWAADIADAKGAKNKELRRAFRKKHGFNFSRERMAEILAKEKALAATEVSSEAKPENLPETENDITAESFKAVESRVVLGISDLDEIVKKQNAAGAKELVTIENPELIKAVDEIDEKINETVISAKEEISLSASESNDELSEEKKRELETLNDELNNLSIMANERYNKLSNVELSGEEKKMLENEIDAIGENQVAIIHKMNIIRGKETSEILEEAKMAAEETPDETKEKTSPALESGAETSVASVTEQINEVAPGPIVEPTAEIEVEPVMVSTGEPFTEPVVESETVQTGEPAPEVVIEPKPEEPKDEVLEKFKEFNIGEEEIKTIPGFAELTQAQQFLVYEGLKQMALVEVKDKARQGVDAKLQSRMKEVTSDMGFWRRNYTKIVNASKGVIPGLTKKYDIAKKEKEEAKNIKSGGLALHKDNIGELTNMISAMRIDATIKDGQLNINYLHNRDSLNPEQNKSLNDFNEIAYKFSQVPKDWSFKTASKKEQEQYQNLEISYKAARENTLKVLETDPAGGHAAFEMNQADYQIKMMQFLAANPEIDKEFSKIEKQSALKKMISGEATARGSYMAGGFVVRHSLTGLIGFGGLPLAAASFVAIPLTAAGIGAWRSRDRAKKSLNEKDIAGRKADNLPEKTGMENIRLQIINDMNNLVPLEYRSVTARDEWLETKATDEEKERFKFLKAKYEGLMYGYDDEDNAKRLKIVEKFKKLIPTEYNVSPESRDEWLKTKATDEEKNKYNSLKGDYFSFKSFYNKYEEADRNKTEKHFYQAEDFTEKLIRLNNTVNSSFDEKYTDALYSLKVRIQFTEEKIESGLVNFGETSALRTKLDLVQALSEARANLALNAGSLRRKEYELKGEEIIREEKLLNQDENYDHNYERNSRDVEKRFESLFASKYLEFDKTLSEARKKYIIKKMVQGAGIGASFAIGGMLLRELAGQLGIIDNHGGSHGKTRTGGQDVEKNAGSGQNNADLLQRAAARALTGEANKEVYEPISQSPVEDASTNNAKIFSDRISNEGLNGGSDSIWRSTREIFKNNAEKLGYEGDANDSEALNKWAETQTANAVHNSGKITDKVFEGNNVLLEKDSNGDFFVKVETGEGLKPGNLSQIEEVTNSVAEKTINSLESKPAIEVPIDKQLECPVDPNETAAQELVKQYNLESDKFSYGGAEGVLKATYGNHEFFINTNDCTLHLGSINGPDSDIELGERVLGENSPWEAIKQFSDIATKYETMAASNGFNFKPEDMLSNNYMKANLAEHSIIINLDKNLFSYDWNGEEHEYSFQPGESAKSNIEGFLEDRGEIERAVETVQNNLLIGKVKSFASLQHQLEELNNGNVLTENENSLWRGVYQENFAKKSASLLGDDAKLKVLQNTMNIFLSGGAR